MQIVIVPEHTNPALTFPPNVGHVSTEPQGTGGDFQLEVLAEKILVEPGAVTVGPAHHPVPHPPLIPVIKVPASRVTPQHKLSRGLRNLGERGENRSKYRYQPIPPTL